MGSAFSSKKKSAGPQPSEVDKAVLSLKTQRRKLGEYERQVKLKVVQAQEQAQACVREKNKTRAMFNLKQKKIFQVRLQEIEQYLVNIEETLLNIDTARQNNKVFEALKTGSAALKTIQSKVSLASLQELVSDTEEQKEHEREVNMILSEENIGLEEVETELMSLEKEVFGPTQEETTTAAAAASTAEEDLELPDVPKTELPATQEKNQGATEPNSRSAEQPMLAA